MGLISFPWPLLCTEAVPAGITCIIHEPTRRSQGVPGRVQKTNPVLQVGGRNGGGIKKKRRLKNDPVLGILFAKYLWKPH